MKYKYLIIIIITIVINGCNSQKSTVKSNKYQEDELEKRQEAFDELYDEHH